MAIRNSTLESEFLSLETISDRIEAVLLHSPADETEIVWLEKRRGKSRKRNRQIEGRLNHERTIMVRVIDRRRVGSHRTGFGEIGELENAIRLAIAQSRSREPLPGLLHVPADESPLPEIGGLWDPQIAQLNRSEPSGFSSPGQPIGASWTSNGPPHALPSSTLGECGGRPL